jgi:hypothetical protein
MRQLDRATITRAPRRAARGPAAAESRGRVSRAAPAERPTSSSSCVSRSTTIQTGLSTC